MQKQTRPATSKATRKGDTARTSSLGRKLSPGGGLLKKIDENKKKPKAESKKQRIEVPGAGKNIQL